MKKIIIPIAVVFLLSCNTAPSTSTEQVSVSNPINANDVTANKNKELETAATALTPKADKDVKYYYEKYANVDSEDPAIGVGPREIIEEDIQSGIIAYKGSDGQIRTIKTWNTANYDIIDYSGGVLLVQGDKEFVPAQSQKIIDLLKATIDQRSARGGECTYAENPTIEVVDGKVLLQLTCTDNVQFKQTLAEITIKNAQLHLLEK